MPYFPSTEMKTVPLRDGKTIDVRPKKISVDANRQASKELREAELRAERIERLEEKAKDPHLSTEEFQAIENEINMLRAKPDQVDAIITYLLATTDCQDYYQTEEDFNARRPLPWDAKSLRAHADPNVLAQIVAYFNTQIEPTNAEGNGSQPRSTPLLLEATGTSATQTESIS